MDAACVEVQDLPGEHHACRPGWHDAVRTSVGNQLAHVLVIVTEDAQVHAVYVYGLSIDLDVAL